MAFISLRLNEGPLVFDVPVLPPVAVILIISLPSLTSLLTDAIHSSTPVATSPNQLRCPPIIVIGLPDIIRSGV